MEFAISSHTGNYSTPNKLVGEMEPIAEATLSLIEQESTESTTMTTTSETQPVVANNNDHSLIVSMPDDEEDDIPARTTPPQLYNGSLQNLRRPTGAEQTVTYRESNHATSIHTSNPHKTKQHPQNHNKHGNHSSPNVTMTPSSATAPSHQPMVVSPSSPPTGRSYDPNGDGTMMVIDSPVASPILMNLTHSPPNNDNNINKSDERIDDMSTIVPCDDQNETADETMTSTQLDILEHHKRHLRRHAAGSDSPEALLGRLQQQHSQQSWNSHGTRHHNMMAMVVDKDPHDENEGLISRRLQEIECKKVALHQKRICLEQRLCDFVDSEKRMRVLAGNTTLSGSMSSSLLMTSNTMARSSQSLALSRSSQSSGGSPSVHSLLKPPIPSPRKVLQQQQQQQQRQSSFICQNGDQMVQDYLWKDPRTKKITYRYSGPLNKQKVPQGWGVMRFLDGQVYEGQIYNGYRWGMGTVSMSKTK